MTAHPPGTYPWLALLFAAAGLAFGWGYFAALRRGVAAYTDQSAIRRRVGWLLARAAAAALFFAFAVRGGPWPLLAAFMGFLGARQIAVRAVRRVT